MATTMDENLLPTQDPRDTTFAEDFLQTKAEQAAARRATDPAEQVKLSGSDGKPICLVVGTLSADPCVIIYARRKSQKGLEQIHPIACYADCRKVPLSNNGCSYRAEATDFKPEYCNLSDRLLRSQIISELSSTVPVDVLKRK